MMQKKWLLSILSGILLALSWPYIGSFTPLVFIGFVPLLIIEDMLYKEGKTSFWSAYKHAYLAFLVFNLLTTFWIYNVQESFGTKLFSAGSAIILNAAFMNVAFALFHITRCRIGNKEGYIGFVLYWISWEYLHLHWELSWPWLTLGNVFSIRTEWIQWYEFTGILGGSLFILILNLLFYKIYLLAIEGNNNALRKYGIGVIVLLLTSYIIGKTSIVSDLPEENGVGIVLVQPNVDPYTEKFQFESSDVKLMEMLAQAEEKITATTRLILFPETALQERTTLHPKDGELILVGLWENDIEQANSIRILREFLETYPDITIIIGISSDRLQEKDEEIVQSSRYIKSLDRHYQSYNAALVIAKDRVVEFYHKSELVPAVEFMPLQWLLKPLTDLAIDMGGTTGTLGTQEDQTPFFTLPDSVGISPAICYESIYGEVSAEFVNNGAQIIGIITNDGWWSESPGFKQHVSYAKLRAIECRKWVARSANTGVSCFINPRGEITQESDWWVKDTMVATIYPNDFKTFYVKHGDYLGRLASFLSIMLIIYTWVRILKKGKSSSIPKAT